MIMICKIRKYLISFDTSDYHKIDDDYNMISKGQKGCVDKEYLNDKFVEKNKGGNHYFDLKNMVIKKTETYCHGLCDDIDVVSKAYVDTGNRKQNIAIADKANKSDALNHDGSGNLDINNNKIINISDSSDPGDAINNNQFISGV